jgi:transposase-like protein
MRYDKRYTRVLNIITDPVIPRVDGVLALCHVHQRAAAMADGFIPYLVKKVKRAASYGDIAIESILAGFRSICPRCGCADKYKLERRNDLFSCKACGHHYSTTSQTALSHKKLPDETMFSVINGLRAGKSALAIERETGVTHKSILYIKSRLADADRIRRK